MTSDDELREQMRRADPAASLPPLPAERVSALVNRVTADPARVEPARRLSKPLVAIVGLAAGVVAVVALSLSGGSETETPLVERVTAESGVQSKCAAPDPAQLGTVDVAVEGQVRSISAGLVTIAVSRVWAGAQVEVLEVQQTDGASESLAGATNFEVGQAYFVAATGGRVLGCGYSGPSSPELRALFEAAF